MRCAARRELVRKVNEEFIVRIITVIITLLMERSYGQRSARCFNWIDDLRASYFSFDRYRVYEINMIGVH